MMIGCLPSWQRGANSCSTASHEKLLPMHNMRMVSLAAWIVHDSVLNVNAIKKE